MPKRIQRKRTKGWKMPENAVYVGRPTKWENPIILNGDCIYININHRRKYCKPGAFYTVGDIDDVLHLYRLLMNHTNFWNKDLQYWSDRMAKLDLAELKGKDLACWCKLGDKCHADILMEIVNK